MKKYVLGFAFNKEKTHVVLIEKLRPEWQKDKFNGVGGKVETWDKSNVHAMCREFFEETGVHTTPDDWQQIGSMVFDADVMGGSAEVFLFRMFDDCIFDCFSAEEEQIHILALSNLNEYPLIKNLKFLIPAALDEDIIDISLNIK